MAHTPPSLKIKKPLSYEILIVDDEEDIRDLVNDILSDEGYVIRSAHNGLTAIESVYLKEPDLVLLDIWLKDSELDGLGILEQLKNRYRYLPIVMISGHGNIPTAVKSLHLGAYDYIEKPFTEDRLKLIVKRAIESKFLRRENDELRASFDEEEIVGNSPQARQLRLTIAKAASSSSRVLISGPQGVGKEVVARLIHKKSKLVNMPFVAVRPLVMQNNQLIDIFGIEDDSVSIYSSLPPRTGIIEQANGGTLFIDEIWALSSEAQLKLLKLLQEKRIHRERGRIAVDISVRVVASSSKDLEEEVRMRRFREDLYCRINVLPVKIDSLKDHSSDILELCEYFMKIICNSAGLPFKEFKSETIIAMQSYDWPGNIRQLKNVVEWLLIMSQVDSIAPQDLPIEIRNGAPLSDALGSRVISSTLKEAREEFEKQYLKAQLTRFNGNISKTAEFIGMERSALHRKLKALGLCSTVL